jgi:hypothetical protein
MSSVTESPKASKPRSRKVGLVLPLNGQGQNGVVRITEVVGKRAPRVVVDEYLVDRVASEIGGEAFRMVKRDYDPSRDHDYHVLVHGDASTCECDGFNSHGHCRHVESLAALLVAGRL